MQRLRFGQDLLAALLSLGECIFDRVVSCSYFGLGLPTVRFQAHSRNCDRLLQGASLTFQVGAP